MYIPFSIVFFVFPFFLLLFSAQSDLHIMRAAADSCLHIACQKFVFSRARVVHFVNIQLAADEYYHTWFSSKEKYRLNAPSVATVIRVSVNIELSRFVNVEFIADLNAPFIFFSLK